MDVKIDGSPLAFTPDESSTVNDALEAVREAVRQQHRVVFTIQLDGEEVHAVKDEAKLRKPCSQVQTLEITTKDPVVMAVSALKSLEPFLEQLQGAHEKAAELLHMGKGPEFSELLLNCIRGWNLVISGVRDLGSILAGIPAASEFPVDEMRANVQQLNQAVRALKTSYEHQDPSRLADVLEYDLAERLTYWRDTLARLRRLLKPGAPGNGEA